MFAIAITKGMTCSSCVYKLERETKKLKGVKEVNISLMTNRGIFKYDTNSTLGPRDIIEKVLK